MAKKSKTNVTLGQLFEGYTASLEERGHSEGTVFSYRQELRLAAAEFGGETLVGALTRNAVAAFNVSPRITQLRSGKPKSDLSIAKSRRTLRQALTWAHDAGLMPEPIVDAKRDEMPLPQTPDVTVVVGDKVVTDATPRKKRRSTKALEVPQDVAEAAADAIGL